MAHFKLAEKDLNIFKTISMAFLTIFTLGIPWIFFYEMWAEPHYWKNRWKLHRLLNKGLVKVGHLKTRSFYGDHLTIYSVYIEDIEYSVWIYASGEMTLDCAGLRNNDYIGLFAGSVTTKLLNRIAVRKLKQLAEHSNYLEYEEMSTNCSVK
jgi:hypothetical protein